MINTSFFWDTEYTIPPGAGFRPWCVGHLLWIALAFGLCLFLGRLYRGWGESFRRTARRAVAVLLVVDELLKYYIALRSGNFRLSFLPLHLCSVNIFLIATDAIRPSQCLREVLYAVCLPGALLALIFPGWAYLPLANALCIHSFTAHILLLLYPVLLLCGGFSPCFQRLAKVLPVAFLVAVGIYFFNQAFGTNFMFLARAGENNPLAWFESWLGSPGYLLGIPLIAGVLWTVMYCCPLAIRRRRGS